MKRQIISMIVVLTFVFTLVLTSIINTKAADNSKEKTDGSYLTMNDASKSSLSDRVAGFGEFIMDGQCSITKSGIGRIYVYAATTANFTVDYLSTVLYVDQYNEKDKAWEQIDAWQVEDFDTYYNSTSKMMKVPRGYYYRVHADHVAGNRANYPYDEVASYTDGIFIN